VAAAHAKVNKAKEKAAKSKHDAEITAVTHKEAAAKKIQE